MKEIKKLMITLVALLALTTGAWADGIVCTASDLGKVLCTDGSIYENVSAATTAGKTAAAMIAYVDETNKNGLALALTDEDAMTWDNSAPSNKGKTAPELCSALNTSKAVTGCTWKLPSQDEWKQMFSANGGNEGSYTGLNTAIGNAGGTALMENEDYWSSSEVDYDAWLVSLADGNASWGTEGKHYQRFVRACLAFDIAASSGPEVAWDKAAKTGTFTMPGGNVELEPEYYPQAALTAAPTAINDVPATTDGAIVKAGTVKNIGTTETAQGTVMYYVSPTALDDAALLALAADQWTADVPTAAKLTKGQAYVYYYVRGNDSDTDEENFSDGDILAANVVNVTLAAAPLWNAEFDLTDAPEEDKAPGVWSTDIPEGGVVKGTEVKVTYTGSKKIIGVKAEKKAAAGIVNPVVGQIIGSDGKNYDANATLPTGVDKVAMIAYVGNDAETSTTYNHGLALALGDVSDKKAWCSQYQKTCLTTQYGSADAAKGDMAGIANTDALVNHTGHSHAAASAARDYNGGTHPMGTSEWFLPSAGQWDKMASAAGGYVKLRTNAGLQSDYYWSSTERDASYAWYFSSHNGDWLKDYKDIYSHLVRACLAF